MEIPSHVSAGRARQVNGKLLGNDSAGTAVCLARSLHHALPFSVKNNSMAVAMWELAQQDI